MNYFLLLFFLFCFHPAFSQSNEMKLYEDSIRESHQQIMNQENDSLKLILAKKMMLLVSSVFQKEESRLYPFDSLKTIAVLRPSDHSFCILNWEVALSDASIVYFAVVQTYNKKKKQLLVSDLVDESAQVKKPENLSLEAPKWYGAHYYKLIESSTKKKKYYTLLGANWSNTLLRKKVIDVISISTDGKAKFGDAIFQNNKITQKRVIFQYAAEISMSLRYDENKRRILFDHLVPRSPELKGQYEFYGPDMSIDGYEFRKGKWNLIEDVDARNEKRK